MHRLLCSTMLMLMKLLKVIPMFISLCLLAIHVTRKAAILCKFRGSGQTCVCANRIFVQSAVYAEFASRLAARVASFKVGNGLEEGM
jgi:acyl-CoA reductase-like NAD-dependent aldehyde dehydrogenase